MKKLIGTIAMMALAISTVLAAPALPGPFSVSQPDGSRITIRQYGDEYHHWTETTDGMLVVNTLSGCFVATIADDGTLQPSRLLAHEAPQRSMAEREAMQQQKNRRHLIEQRALREQAKHMVPSISESGRYLPHEGSPRVLVILTAYQDVPFTVNDPVKAFNQYLNGDDQVNLGNMNSLNVASVRQYFNVSSHGHFTPQFDVVGPVTLPDSMAYYGKNENMSALCRDAVALVKDSVDFRLYDNDGDERAELVYIIFAGYGENQRGPSEAMWAKTSTLNMTVDSTIVTRFCCGSELFVPDPVEYKDFINGIGVFTHEFSHAMGLPDIYATSSTGYINNQTMERWDIMDQGIYNYNGFAPAPYLAWEQEIMGWTEVEPLVNNTQSITVLPLIEEGGKAYKMPNADNERESIYMENIQLRGYNYKAAGHGLLVYHVAYPYNNVNMGDSPNNKASRPAVSVVPADSLFIAIWQTTSYPQYGGTYTLSQYTASFEGDPFPGKANVTELTDSMRLPNFQFYGDGEMLPVGRSLTAISEDASTGQVSFTFVGPAEQTAISELVVSANKTSAVYDLMGRQLINGHQLSKGLYIVSGRKVLVR